MRYNDGLGFGEPVSQNPLSDTSRTMTDELENAVKEVLNQYITGEDALIIIDEIAKRVAKMQASQALIERECNRARIDTLKSIYEQRYIVSLEPGVSRAVVTANEIKQLIIKLQSNTDGDKK